MAPKFWSILFAAVSLVACSSSDDSPAAATTTADGGTDSAAAASTSSASCSGTLPGDTTGASVHIAADIPDFAAGDYTTDGRGPTCPSACGFAGQRNNDEFFMNTHGDVDATKQSALSVRFGGLNRVGTFKCGEQAKQNDSYAVPTTLEVWASINTKASPLTMYKGSAAGASCAVTVTKISAEGVEGCYTGTLIDGTGQKLEVSGAFREHANKP